VERLFNVTVKCEYALRALLDLTLQHGKGPVRIADIARRQEIPQKFLELILAELKRHGWVESRRGAEGGYLLARPTDMITPGEVLRALEGAEPAAPSPLEGFWKSANLAVAAVADKTTFAELAREYRERRAHWVPNWDI
jgi:Rrf2 family protein